MEGMLGLALEHLALHLALRLALLTLGLALYRMDLAQMSLAFDLQPDLLLEPDQLKLGLDMTQTSYQKIRDAPDSRTAASGSLSLTSSASVSGSAVLNDYGERYVN